MNLIQIHNKFINFDHVEEVTFQGSGEQLRAQIKGRNASGEYVFAYAEGESAHKLFKLLHGKAAVISDWEPPK